MITRGKILVMGSCNMDMVMEVDHIPVVGETILAKSKVDIPGGKGANQVVACARLGGDATFLGVVGKDDNGRILSATMESHGVNTKYIKHLDDVPTGMTALMVDQEGDNTIVVIQGANLKCDFTYLMNSIDCLETHDIVMAQLEIPIDGVYEMLRLAKQKGKITILDPAPAPMEIPDEVLATIDYFTPNETELALLSGNPVDSLETAESCARLFVQKGVQNVLVTMGTKGSLLLNKNGVTHYPAIPKIKAIDTTAAGDTFNAAFAVALSEGIPVSECIRFATKAAAIAVSRKGAQASIPLREEVDNMKDLS